MENVVGRTSQPVKGRALVLQTASKFWKERRGGEGVSSTERGEGEAT